MNTINYDFFIHIIYLEVFLIIFVVLWCYCLHGVNSAYQQHRNGLIKKLVSAFLRSSELANLPNIRFVIYPYLVAIQELKSKKQMKDDPLLTEWIRENISPKIKKSVESIFWYRRYLAAKALQEPLTPFDEDSVALLLMDERPSVLVEAVIAMQRSPNERLVNALIEKIAFYARKNHEFYLDLFLTMPSSVQHLVEKRLGYERRRFERALCYHILSYFPNSSLCPESYSDVKSPHLELSVAALKHICQVVKPSTQFMASCLEDPRPDVAVLMLSKIKQNHWVEAVPLLEPLTHSNNLLLKKEAKICLDSLVKNK